MGNPLVTPIVELRHEWGFLIWDPSNGIVTRAQIVLAVGFGTLTAGMVLAQLTVGAASAAALGTNTGNGTVGAITVGPTAVVGVYTINFDSPTVFTVSNPEGQEVGHGATGAAFTGGGLSFTVAAGGTAFVAGDAFALTLAAGSGQYVPYDPTGANGNGSEVAVAILGSYRKNTATLAQNAGALTRGPCRVNSSELLWWTTITSPTQQAVGLAQLGALGILFTV